MCLEGNYKMGCSSSSKVKLSPPFIWGDSGSVLIKSIKLILTYDPTHKSIKTQVANDKITESLLTWQGRLFTLQDLFITDLSTKKRIKCPEFKAKFSINESDQFNELLETENLLLRLNEIYQQNTDSLRSSLLINTIKRDCKDLWDFSKEFWARHKNRATRQELAHFGKECVSLVVEKATSEQKIQKFLIQKYKATSFRKLKKHIKAKIIMQASDQRPHIIKSRKSVILDFFVQLQHLVEIEEHVKVLIFCWDDVPQLNDSEFIMEELKKMEKGVTIVYSDLKQDIDMLE